MDATICHAGDSQHALQTVPHKMRSLTTLAVHLLALKPCKIGGKLSSNFLPEPRFDSRLQKLKHYSYM